MKRLHLIAALAGLLARSAGGLAAASSAAPPIHFKPGRWVELPPLPPGRVTAPGTTTVIETAQADAQYALPMSDPWTAAVGGANLDTAGVPEGAWLAAELDHGTGARMTSRDGILKALPPGSSLVRLDHIRRGVPESVDLVICHDFSESKLQPQERAAVRRFARRGGAVFLIFASRAIPAASEELWRDLFGAHGKREKQAPGLPRRFLVPSDFALRFDPDMPRLVWQRCGRGVVLAYGLAPGRNILERPEGTTRLFARALAHIRKNRRPLTVGPVDPGVFGLFERADWSARARRRFALLACGYAAAAIGLLLSFGTLLTRRRWVRSVAVLCIAGGGAAILMALTAGTSGLALDNVAVIMQEPGADPTEVVFARISRLGPGRAPQLRSASAMPPRLVLYSRFSARLKNWVNYRFRPGGATVEPDLEVGQKACLVAIRTTSVESARSSTSAPDAPPPPKAEHIIEFVRQRWTTADMDYTFRWVRPSFPPRAFDVSADKHFVQIHRGPVLLVTAARKKVQPQPGTNEHPTFNIEPPTFKPGTRRGVVRELPSSPSLLLDSGARGE